MKGGGSETQGEIYKGLRGKSSIAVSLDRDMGLSCLG